MTMRRLSMLFDNVTNHMSLFSWIFTLVMFVVVVVPLEEDRLLEAAGTTASPDTAVFYGPRLLEGIIETYDEEGRDHYIMSRLTFDLVWPVIYTAVLISMLSMLYRFESGPLGLSNLVPLGVFAFDLLENTTVSILMATFPSLPEALLWLSAIFSALKWLCLAFSVLLVLLGVFKAVSKRRADHQE
jgi:tryptophan-rich sensory protein